MHFTDSILYQRALELVDLSREILADLPSGSGFLADQLRRASTSVVLNFAEGCGKESAADRRRYFRTARGSVYETRAICDVGERLGVVAATKAARGRDLCGQLGAMLTRWR